MHSFLDLLKAAAAKKAVTMIWWKTSFFGLCVNAKIVKVVGMRFIE